MIDQNAASADAPQRVECPANKEPSVRMFIVAAMCLGYGAYALYEILSGARQPGNEWYGFTLWSGLIAPVVGLVPLVWGVLMLRRRFVADAEGLGYVGDRKVPWSAIAKLVLRGKGLFDVHYQADGETGVFKLDEYKLQNFAELVRLIETNASSAPTEKAE